MKNFYSFYFWRLNLLFKLYKYTLHICGVCFFLYRFLIGPSHPFSFLRAHVEDSRPPNQGFFSTYPAEIHLSFPLLLKSSRTVLRYTSQSQIDFSRNQSLTTLTTPSVARRGRLTRWFDARTRSSTARRGVHWTSGAVGPDKNGSVKQRADPTGLSPRPVVPLDLPRHDEQALV